MSLLEQIQLARKRNLGISFKSGDQVKVFFKIIEGKSERIQIFEGVVIRIRGSCLSKTFTVRKISFGVGVERIFPVHSPRVEKVDIVKRGKVRRAKLYYLRNLSGKAARISEDSSKRIQEKNLLS
jgi:large subunit ribosomal protein L19